MKYLYLFLLITIILYSCADKTQQEKEPSQEKKSMGLNKSIDWKQFQNDLKYVHEGGGLPLNNGVFPVYEYESSGNGNVEKILQLDNHHYIQQSVFVYQGDYNTTFFDGVKDQDQELVFFTLLVKTNHIDSANQIMSSSRNHPTYLAQGIVNVENNQKIKWVASHNSEKNSDILIVNMKYFDLEKGRLVIVYPKEDGSLRFEQVNLQQKSLSTLEQIIQMKGTIWHNDLKKRIKEEKRF